VRSAEPVGEVALTVEQLAHERLARGHHAVGLDPHAADRLEAPAGGQLTQALEQRRIVLLEEGEELGRRLVEVKAGMTLEQAGRRRERPPRLTPRLDQRPAPREVEVGVAGQRQSPGRRVPRCQRAELALEHGGGGEHAGSGVLVERRWPRVEPRRRLPHVPLQLGAGDPAEVRPRGAWPVELAQAACGGVGHRPGRLVTAERAAGLEHESE
jgi:hypothetical protein